MNTIYWHNRTNFFQVYIFLRQSKKPLLHNRLFEYQHFAHFFPLKGFGLNYTRDIPDLFKYNAFVVISDGANNKYGSIFAGYDYFYAWRKIDDGVEEVDGINSLYSMVKGLFRKDRLIAVIKDFIFFPDQSNKELKLVCRYPQYFAATKLLENIKVHQKPDGDGKGGTYFGATGCGKSYTMLFLTRMLMRSECFKSPTIILITDRTDLDTQLGASVRHSIHTQQALNKLRIAFVFDNIQVVFLYDFCKVIFSSVIRKPNHRNTLF